MKTIQINAESRKNLQCLYPWVYKNQIASSAERIEPGEVVQVQHGGETLGLGYANYHSEIVIRMLGFGMEAWNEGELARRIGAAIGRRDALKKGSDALRLVHAEADLLPGLIVDRYADVAVVQINTAGMERYRELILERLRQLLSPKAIYEKSSANHRKAEGLPPAEGLLFGELSGGVEVREHGIAYGVDLLDAQKTGLYLDQRANRHFIAQWVPSDGRMLDLFCHAGGFGLHALKAGAGEVVFVDISKSAMESVRFHLNHNGLGEGVCVNQDGFDYLKEALARGERFGCIVLDPPPFAKKKSEMPGALKGMRYLFANALKLLQPGGVIAIFSCSHHLGEEALLKIALECGARQNRYLQQLSTLTQDLDHPIIVQIPSSKYLSGLLFRAF